MKRIAHLFFISALFFANAEAQLTSKFIVIDQFGYLPDEHKKAIIRDPHIGYDAEKSYFPGETYAVVNALSKQIVFSGGIQEWNNGTTDHSSGDKVWYFDFTEVTENGLYFILDESNNTRSYTFEISPAVYKNVLKHAMRTFYYQRVGYAKEPPYADKRWADDASHIGPLQDKNCRLYNDKDNPSTEKDLSGGWYDAGDYNKYTNWTANYVVEFMKAYLEKPEAWGDDYDIPESGNGIPDILDEALWGIDHLLRMQLNDGSVLSIVGEAGGSPPSSSTGQSLYGPANTSATLNTCGAFAIASKVYRQIGMTDYADTLINRSIKAWNWAEANPSVLFRNNDNAYNSRGLGAGQQETDDYGRLTAKLEAAVFLFEVTDNPDYRDFFDANYEQVNMIQWNFVFPFQANNQEMLLYYTTLDGATEGVKNKIINTYKNAMINGSENFPAYDLVKDPYLAHIKDYTWGSNGQKSSKANMFLNMVSYNLDVDLNEKSMEAALGYVHYLHGVNPFNMVYLSNMYEYGGENCVNEFYHSWFTNGSKKWDRVGESTYGPAPGFLTGGPNPGYNWDGCCPSDCGSSSNNAKCYDENISPPLDQPDQKSYKDFNHSWPLNSWSVTENSCGYQVRYIRMLSKFVEAKMDCNGDVEGTAFIDTCGICSGGLTEREPETDPCKCSLNLESHMEEVACDFLVSPSGKYTWYETGVYNDTIQSFHGCDSVITIYVVIKKNDLNKPYPGMEIV